MEKEELGKLTEEELKEKIEEAIDNVECDDDGMQNEADIVDAVEAVIGRALCYGDSGIDDGCREDEEDNYVMYQHYSCTVPAIDEYGDEIYFHVHLKTYYGDETLKCGYYTLEVE